MSENTSNAVSSWFSLIVLSRTLPHAWLHKLGTCVYWMLVASLEDLHSECETASSYVYCLLICKEMYFDAFRLVCAGKGLKTIQ